MGRFINKGNEDFIEALALDYVDKSLMISIINETLNTERRYSCITRCRRFGKSMAAKMLRAYYDSSCDSHRTFNDLAIAKDPSYEKYLNKYYVIYLDVTDFTTKYANDAHIVKHIQKAITEDILSAFPVVERASDDDLMDVLIKARETTDRKFIMIIDEWDAILREFDRNLDVFDEYINLYRRLFKGSDSMHVFAGVYITGILPIKKYNTQSALNNFREYSMIKPGKLASFLGFTHEEVDALCEKHKMNLIEMEQWYDGYKIGNQSTMFNPYSVMEAITTAHFESYWSNTGAYDSVKTYIQMNFEGLKDDIIKMLAGESVGVNTTSFQNDMRIINNRDDVLTVLIHLGYLSYDEDTQTCRIPNKEVANEMSNAVKATEWKRLVETLQNSRTLLDATLAGNEVVVAKAIDIAHDENTSILSYNDENSLACVLSIAYLWANNNYIIHREYATGKGFADLVLIPRQNVYTPAIIVELKYNQNSESAIEQIKNKNYPQKVAEYSGDILLVGINYDKVTKKHSCKIEKINKLNYE